MASLGQTANGNTPTTYGKPWERYQKQGVSQPTGKPWERYAPQPPAVQTAPEPVNDEAFLMDHIMSGAEQVSDTGGFFAQSLAKGITSLAGAPVDLVNASPMLLNILPGEQGMKPFSENPFGGSEQLWELFTAPRDALQAATGSEVGDAVPNNAFERIGGRIFEELGAMAIPVGAVMLKAGRIGVEGARSLQRSERPITRMAGNLAESAAVNPGKFVGKEAAYATGAGTGAGVAVEAVSDGDPNTTTESEALADLLGAILGATGTAVGDAAYRAGADGLAAITGGGTQVVKDAVTGELARAGAAPLAPSGAADTTRLARALGSSPRASATVPGFQESTADMAQSPGLASLEYARQSGPNAGDYAQRRHANAAATNQALDDVAPKATPGAFRETLSARRDDALLDAQTRAYVANAEFDAAAKKLAAVQDGEARGQTVRAALEEALVKAKEVEREAWSGVTGTVDPSELSAAFDRVTAGLTKAQQNDISEMTGVLAIPKRLSGAADDLDEDAALMAQVFGATAGEATAAPVRLAEVTTLRSSITDRIRAARSAGQNDVARTLDGYVAAIDGFLDNAAPEVVEQMEAARAVTRDLNDRFTRPGEAISQTLSKNQGRYRVPDSNVSGKFVQPDERQIGNVNRLLEETGDAADVRDALQDQVKADAKDLLANPVRLDQFVKRHGHVFEKFPELRDEFGSVAALRKKAEEAGNAAKVTERELGAPGKTGSGPVGKYLEFGGERAVDAMSGVVNARDPAKAADELLRFVDDAPEAVEGARAAFWQLMERDARSAGATTRTGGGQQTWRPASLHNFLQSPQKRAVMERLYRDNPAQMERIVEIAEALRLVDTRSTARAPNTSGTPQSVAGSRILPNTETIGAYAFAHQRGQVGLPFIGLRLVSTMARRAILNNRTKDFQKLLDEALLNPDVAEALLRENNPANVAALTRSAKGWRIGLAPTVADLAGDEPEDEALMRAIEAK